MAVADSYFANSYTFTISGMASSFEQYAQGIEANAVAVIEYLSNYVSWQGTMDFVVRFGDPFQFDHNGTGLLPAYGGTTASGATFAAHKAQTGLDANGTDWDAGAYILPNVDGRLTNHGDELYIDPNPDAYARPNVPAGQHDFFSIYLHEVMHSFGFWSTAQHGHQYGVSDFDALTVERDGQYFFTGSNAHALLGQDLPLARPENGSRDHYGTAIDGNSPVTRGAVFEFGHYEQNRWHLGQLELAVLKDLGWTVANEHTLPLVEVPDHEYIGVPIDSFVGDFVYSGTSGDDVLVGGRGNDIFTGSLGTDFIDGDGGTDTVVYALSRSVTDLHWEADGTITVAKPDGGRDTLINIERVHFSDDILIFDIDSPNAAAAYRLYGGAFDRTPDEAGLRFWTNDWLDQGGTLADAAAGFIASPEFTSLYGTDLTDLQFVEQLYFNVLGRPGERDGVDFWVDYLGNGQGDRANVLVDFTQLPEYVGLSAADIDNGFVVI